MDFLESDYKYHTTFYSSASVLVPEDRDEFFAKASLDMLRGLLPPNINPADNPDLLYFAANGAVAGLCNSNGDSIDVQTALDIVPRCQYKYINIDHKKEDVAGVLLYPGISKFNSSELLTKEDAANLSYFNLSMVGVVWRPLNKELVKALLESADPTSKYFGRISLSWEIYFNDYDIAIGSRVVNEATIISDPEEKKKYQKYLKKNKGKGEFEGQPIYRVIRNTNGPESPNVIIAGYSWVTVPAADVKGFVILNEPNVLSPELAQENEIAAVEPVLELEIAVAQTNNDNSDIIIEDNANLISQCQPQPVITNIITPMDIKELNDISAQWELLSKLEAKAGADTVIKFFTAETKRMSEEWSAKVKEKEVAEAATKDSLTKALADVQVMKTELAEIKQIEVARASQEKFDERMNELDSEFDLEDDDRKVVVAEITGATDEAFASFKSKFFVLAKEKNKKWKAEKKKKEDDEATEKANASGKEELARKEAERIALAEQALASAEANKNNPVITNGVDPKVDLLNQYKDMFKFTIGDKRKK